MANFIVYPSSVRDKEEWYTQQKKYVKYLKRDLRKEKIDFFLNNKKLLLKRFLYWAFPFVVTIIAAYAVYVLVPPPEIIKKTEVVYLDDAEKSHDAFLNKLGTLESGNDYSIINKFGYMGRYQIGRQALTDVGLGAISQQDFLSSPELQEVAMKMLMKKNKQYLQSYIGKYQSKTIKGIYITESGLLAGAHAVGYGAVIKWLESKGQVDPTDGNGVKVSKRIREFSNYKLIFN